MNPNPSFQASTDAQVIARRLAKLQFDETISYKELTALVPDRKLQGKDRFILNTARNIVLRENNIVTAAVTGVGIKRLTDVDITTIPEAAIAKTRRFTKRAMKQTICANYDQLQPTDKIKFNTGLSVLGAIQHFTKPKTQEMIGDKVKESAARLSIEDAAKSSLALFNKS